MPTKYRIATSEVNANGKPLADYWYSLRYHELQSAAYFSDRRFVGLDCGRGSGKTELARRRIVRWLPVKRDWVDPLYFYALPTYAQARRVAWEQILSLIPKSWIRGTPLESRMEIKTVFGSTLYVVGMDKPERIEGSQYDGGIVDESCDQKPGHFTRTILPALTHRNGWCWRIGVPKRYGPGASEFREYCEQHRKGEESPDHIAFNWASDTVLDDTQIETLASSMSETDFAEQVGATWQSIGGRIFKAFGLHNVQEVNYDSSKLIVVGSDFNVNPMSWVLCQLGSDRTTLHAFDEVFLRDVTTQAALDNLYSRYGSHGAGWLFIGDATARSRKTSAATTDYVQIANDDRFQNKKVRYLKSNPPRADRFASCNAMFRSARGAVRFTVDPRVKHLINDLTNRVYAEGTREPDDGIDMGHMSDALGYPLHALFPMRVEVTEEKTPEVVLA